MSSPRKRTDALTLGVLQTMVDELLKNGVPSDTVVYSEGCDCTGKAHSIEIVGNELLVTRSDEP